MPRTKTAIRLKRVYEAPIPDDGSRILVERLWPRGVNKQKAAIDHWAKEVAPSPDLRKWYGHDADKWDEFGRRYRAELDKNVEALDDLKQQMRNGPVTFVYAASDEAHNSALVRKEYLERGARS